MSPASRPLEAMLTNAQTYADTLSAEFSAKRHLEIPLRALRSQEHEILTTSRSLRPQDPLDALNALTHRTLDALDALPVSAQTQQIRRTVVRCAGRAFVRHPRGIPFARALIGRGEGVDGDTLGILIRRFRYAQVNNDPWALPSDPTPHRTAFHAFLGQELTRLRTLSPDIFTQIMDIHIDNGMSVSSLTGLINQCMALRAQWSGRWTPAAWQVIIQAYRRDGDLQGCMRTYVAFREAQETRDDEGWERYVKGTEAWPYEALLAACTDPKRVAKGKYTAPADMPEVIWRDMQDDGVPPPPRLVAHLLNLARENADAEAGHRLWRASTNVDIGCYTAYLHLIRCHCPTTPLRPLIRRILESKITANQTAPRVAALWRHALLAALAPGRSDFPLARFLLDRCTHDETTLDAVGARLFAYSKSRPRGAAWWRSVWNAEPPSLRHAPMGIQSRNARTRRLTRAEWDLVSRRIRELGGEDAVLPLSRPLARWERSLNPYAPQSSSGDVDLEPVKRALIVLLERCIGTRPTVGVAWEGATPEGRVRGAREGVYRDLFGS